MEIKLTGSGFVTIRYVDRLGRTLVEQRLGGFGSATSETISTVPLVVGTAAGDVPVAPVLIAVPGGQPLVQVIFDGQLPTKFTVDRCKGIGCLEFVLKEAEAGRACAIDERLVLGAGSDGDEPA